MEKKIIVEDFRQIDEDLVGKTVEEACDYLLKLREEAVAQGFHDDSLKIEKHEDGDYSYYWASLWLSGERYETDREFARRLKRETYNEERRRERQRLKEKK